MIKKIYLIGKLRLVIDKVYDDRDYYYITFDSDLNHLVDCFKPFDTTEKAKDYYKSEIKKILSAIN